MEEVHERADYPPQKLKQLFANDTLAMLGYGCAAHWHTAPPLRPTPQ